VGVVAAATSPLVPLAALLGVGLLALVLWRPMVGVWLFVIVVASLPFGVIPLPVAGAQLTFVDAVMIATFLGVVSRWVSTSARVPLDIPSVALIAFVLVAVAAFLAGGSVSPITPELVRRTGKLLVSLLFFLVSRSILSTPDRLASLARGLMFAGALQGAVGTALMALPPLTQLTLLTRLGVIGYPTSNVLRYVPGPNATYTEQLRAIGTSVDPNVFGGTLMLSLVVIVVQWAGPRPVLPKLLLVLLALPTAAGVLLSLSRASWLGLAVGLALIGLVRYRRILVLGVLGGLGVLASPAGQAFITRFVGGFSTTDPATAFRVGEYANALTLLSRYPLLGIGFGASPDIDVTAGVSSVYLLVAEQTGILGLAVFALALAATWLIGMKHVTDMRDGRLQGIRAAFFAAFSGALVTGLLDHYFANQDFPHAVALFWLYAAMLVSASQSGQLALRNAEPERAATAGPAALRAHPTAVQ
jgi:polysaccharide biosynthesis protein PslJ